MDSRMLSVGTNQEEPGDESGLRATATVQSSVTRFHLRTRILIEIVTEPPVTSAGYSRRGKLYSNRVVYSRSLA